MDIPPCKFMMHYITLKKNFDINDVMERLKVDWFI